MVIRVLYEERKAWGQQFGGGMTSFDKPWLDALREGKSDAEAVKLGANALLDAFTQRLRERFERLPLLPAGSESES